MGYARLPFLIRTPSHQAPSGDAIAGAESGAQLDIAWLSHETNAISPAAHDEHLPLTDQVDEEPHLVRLEGALDLPADGSVVLPVGKVDADVVR
jgi:hypothetical protein